MILKLHQKEVIKAQKEFGEEFLVMMKQNPKVKELLIKECQQQKFGDYYVRTQDFLNQLSVDFPDNSQMNIQLANRLKRLTELEKTNPIIFMPSAETKEEGTISLFSTLHDFEVLVPDFENPAPNDSYPGYVLDNQNQLVYYQQVNEEFAWEYDVIVIGFEEDLPLESMTAGPDDNLEKPDYRPIVPNIFRTPGREEWGGIIQVTNMGAIEPWISGKFEFAYYVISNGIKIHEREFGKYKRTHFKDQKWINFNNKIGYWNISNWGNMQIGELASKSRLARNHHNYPIRE